MELTYEEAELSDVAKKLLPQVRPGDTVTFTGELAAGKTTLIRELVKQLGYSGTVNSPTFVIEHRYPIAAKKTSIKHIIHLDLYRMTKKDLEHFDWKEYQDPQTLVFVEWPEIAASYLPKDAKRITLEKVDEKTRRLTFTDNITS